jgi:hypothetical protein
MSTPQTGGGSATQSGTNYQNRVAAWIATQILAEQDASPPWDLPAVTTLDFVRCETLEPVDDVLAGASNSGHAFLQAKHNIDLGKTDDSELASVLDQFVRQFHKHSAVGNNASWERPLDVTRDRMVLVTSQSSSARIRTTLPTILERVRGLASTQTIDTAATSQDDKEVLSTIRAHVSKSWQKLKGADPTEAELRAFLSLVRIQVLDVDQDKAHEQQAKSMLRTSVVRDPVAADAAWNCIVQACAGYAANRSGATRLELQNVLTSAGIDLQGPHSYRSDIQKLTNWSNASLQTLSSLSEMRVTPTTVVKVTRDSTAELASAALSGSLVVVGQPGAGKSGALFDLAHQLQASGDVLIFAVGQFDAGSLGSLRNEIGCTHDIVDVLRNWPSTKPGFLIIDALDAARTEAGARAFRDLIGYVIAQGSRWRVIASIRKYDLRYSNSLQRLFAGSPPSAYRDSEFQAVRHLDIPILSDSELHQVRQQSTELGLIIQNAGPELLKLLRNPFNLRLVAELVGAGANVASLTPIRTQIELLERYWRERVIASDAQADAREAVLRRATTEMVDRRTLRIDRAVVAGDPAASSALGQVLSSQVLVEWQPLPESKPDRYVITYAHHILFDYAAARLLLRGPFEQVLAWLAKEPDLLLAVRPSLLYHFQYLWSLDTNRRRFWDCVFACFKAEGIASTGKIIGPLAASQLIWTLADCEILLNTLRDPSSPDHSAAKEAFRHLMGAVHSSSSDATRPFAGPGAPPWCELLERISEL